jgi:hypothetical protein
MVYKWNGFNYKAKAEDAAEVFSQIEKRDGELTAEAVVESAKSKKSVLHDDFEWDDAIAGEKYRVSQAKRMIGSLTFVSEQQEKEEVSYRAYININSGQQKARVINTQAAMESEEAREVILGNAYRELDIFRSKYQKYAELEKVIAAINETI